MDYKLIKKVFLFFTIILCISCSRKKSESNEEDVLKEDNSLYGEFYIPEDDDALWVQGIVDQTQEEIAAAQINELLEIDNIMKSPYSVNSNEVEFVEKRFADTNRRLKVMEYGTEIFVPVESKGDLIFINKCKGNVVRDFYNKEYRLYKKEIWDMSEKGNEKKLVTQEFFYGAENKPVRQILTYENKTIEYFWQFDDKGRVAMEKEITKEKNSFSSKTQYYNFHENEDVPADYEYWENEVLQVKTLYLSKEAYTTQVFFEDNFSVITEYDKGLKIKDSYIQDGEVVREKVY